MKTGFGHAFQTFALALPGSLRPGRSVIQMEWRSVLVAILASSEMERVAREASAHAETERQLTSAPNTVRMNALIALLATDSQMV